MAERLLAQVTGGRLLVSITVEIEKGGGLLKLATVGLILLNELTIHDICVYRKSLEPLGHSMHDEMMVIIRV